MIRLFFTGNKARDITNLQMVRNNVNGEKQMNVLHNINHIMKEILNFCFYTYSFVDSEQFWDAEYDSGAYF